MFDQLLNSPFLYSLSLSLVHFLWQGLLVGLILKSALLIIDKNKSKLRYGLATLAMLSNVVLALFTFAVVYPDINAGLNVSLNSTPLTHLVSELTPKNALLTYQELMPSAIAISLPYLSLAWLATISFLALKLLMEVRNVNHLPRQATVSPTPELLTRFTELAKEINLPRTPQLLISLKAEVPMAIGWLKPVVLLPAAMVTGLNSAQLEMLILHELAHIRRHDYLINFLQTIIELIFFFHPSVHWIGKQMRNEREYCSDDIAVQHCGDAIAYAHTLTDTATLCSKRHSHTIPTMAMAASGGDLKIRVLRLVNHHCSPRNDTSKWFAAVSLLLALTLLCLNQLLAMPFAQQLSSQLPWDENSAPIIKSIESPKKANKNELSKEQVDTVANSSTLIQQNGHEADIAVRTLVDENDYQVTTEKEVSSVTLIDSTTSPLDNTDSHSTQLSAINTKHTSPDPAVQHTLNVMTTDSNKALRLVEMNETFPITAAEEVQLTLTELEITQKEMNNSASIVTEEKPAEATSITKALSGENSPEQLAKTSVKAPRKSLTELPNAEVDVQQASQTYSQAIDEFELETNKYATSLAQKIQNNQAFANTELQPSLKEENEELISHDAKLLNSAYPVYPSLAKRRGIEMEVQVNFTIDRNGKVKDIDFAQEGKITYFKSAIRSAIRKWRFTPAIINNDVVESRMSKIFSFNLQS